MRIADPTLPRYGTDLISLRSHSSHSLFDWRYFQNCITCPVGKTIEAGVKNFYSL